MNDIPRQTLQHLIATYGLSLCDNPTLCKSLLLDFCGKYRLEINVLINALEENIFIDIMNISKEIPYEILRSRLIKRLHDNRGLAEDYAGWAVDTWVLVLSAKETKSLNVKSLEELPILPRVKKLVIPGGEISARPLHFIWIIDCSSSMNGNKIQSVNTAIQEVIPEMRNAAASNPNVQVLVRAVKFANGAQWHIAQPTPLETFQWVNLNAGGARDMGKALLLVAEQLKVPPMVQRSLPPVLVLISSGYPTDDAIQGLNAIMAEPWGKRAVRLAIGIGSDVDYDTLQKFIGNQEIKVCQPNKLDVLVQYIKWTTIEALQNTSPPIAQSIDTQHSSTLPDIPAPPPISDEQFKDVW